MKMRLVNSVFYRNVLTIVTGTTIAQAISYAVLPVLTRIYTPEDYGVYALFTAISSTIATIATVRYELAIMLPRRESHAANIVILSIIIAGIVSLITFIVIFLWNEEIADLLGNVKIKNWLYVIPLTVLLTGIYQSFNYWNNRKKNYKCIATTRIIQSGTTASVNLGIGFSGVMSGGLIIGYILGQVAAVISLISKILHEDKTQFIKTSKSRGYALFKKYLNFLSYSAFGAIADTFAAQMPIYILSKHFQIDQVGYFSFAFRILILPLTLISDAISKVLFQKISSAKPQYIYALISRILKWLLFLALPIVIIFFFFGESIFYFVFGKGWQTAGKFSQILIFSVAIRFVVSPLSSVLGLYENIKIGAFWQILYLLTIVPTLLFASNFDIITFSWIFVVYELMIYLVYLFFIFKAIRRMNRCVA